MDHRVRNPNNLEQKTTKTKFELPFPAWILTPISTHSELQNTNYTQNWRVWSHKLSLPLYKATRKTKEFDRTNSPKTSLTSKSFDRTKWKLRQWNNTNDDANKNESPTIKHTNEPHTARARRTIWPRSGWTRPEATTAELLRIPVGRRGAPRTFLLLINYYGKQVAAKKQSTAT